MANEGEDVRRLGADEDGVQARDEPDTPERDDPASPARKPIYRRLWFWLVLLAVLVAIAGGVAYYWFRIRPFETTDDAFIGADVVDIAPQVAGTIVAVPVENNAPVVPGELLARVDPTSFEAELNSRQSQLAQVKAQLKRARTGVDQARAQAAEAKASLASQEAQERNARDTLTRNQKLFDSDPRAISEKTVIDSRDAARVAEAATEAARSRLATARTAIPAAEADVAAAEAAVKVAESRVETAQIEVGYTTITAPLPGQVVQKNINVGSYVSPGMPVMAIIPDRLYVTANFKETQLDRIRVGQDVDIKVDAFPDVDFHGTVESIQHGAGQAFQLLPPQNATGNYVKVVQRVPVRISIDSPEPQNYPIGPGMSVVPRISVQ
jgi:membrane fusion protein (multidrug efflux system)